MPEAATRHLAGLPDVSLDRIANASVLIGGAGNIGSPLASFLARAGVRLLRIVDRDRVEAKNISNQDYHPEDVGRSKAEALAERLCSQFPDLTVESFAADLEDVPLGVCAVDLLLGAFDSRRARQLLVSEIGWPLGIPVIDGGVGEGLLGRVQVFVPGDTSACLECGWGEADYRRLVEEYPCVPGAGATGPATLSPAFAGSIVAGLMAAEAVKLLGGPRPSESRELAFDLYHGRFLPSRLRRGAKCRFDHAVVTDRLRVPWAQAASLCRPDGELDAHGMAGTSKAACAHGGPTAGDLIAVLERRFGNLPFHLECRRGLPFGRFLTPDQLHRRSTEPLAALGFVPGDWLRARSASGSVFVILD